MGASQHRSTKGRHIMHNNPLPKGSACSTCKSRKVRCSGSKPACDACRRTARFEGRDPDLVVCSYGAKSCSTKSSPSSKAASPAPAMASTSSSSSSSSRIESLPLRRQSSALSDASAESSRTASSSRLSSSPSSGHRDDHSYWSASSHSSSPASSLMHSPELKPDNSLAPVSYEEYFLPPPAAPVAVAPAYGLPMAFCESPEPANELDLWNLPQQQQQQQQMALGWPSMEALSATNFVNLYANAKIQQVQQPLLPSYSTLFPSLAVNEPNGRSPFAPSSALGAQQSLYAPMPVAFSTPSASMLGLPTPGLEKFGFAGISTPAEVKSSFWDMSESEALWGQLNFA